MGHPPTLLVNTSWSTSVSATPTTILIHYSLVDYLPPTAIQPTHLYLLNIKSSPSFMHRLLPLISILFSFQNTCNIYIYNTYKAANRYRYPINIAFPISSCQSIELPAASALRRGTCVIHKAIFGKHKGGSQQIPLTHH